MAAAVSVRSGEEQLRSPEDLKEPMARMARRSPLAFVLALFVSWLLR